MKKGLTELVFILDRSGSMSGLEKDTIGGYNSMLKKQKAVDGECRITTVLFDHSIELLHDRIDINAVNSITERDYRVGGCTALLDAIGTAIHKIDKAQQNTAKAYRAENVMFIIITDGDENSSKFYTSDTIKELIEHQKEEYGWEFIFLGANIDTAKTADRFGINANRAQSYHADSDGVKLNFCAMSEAVTVFRQEMELPDDWNNEIEADYRNRKNN